MGSYANPDRERFMIVIDDRGDCKRSLSHTYAQMSV